MSTTTPTNKPTPRRFSYTPRPYPVDERGFSPVDTALAKAYAREEMVTNDADGALNPSRVVVRSPPWRGSGVGFGSMGRLTA